MHETKRGYMEWAYNPLNKTEVKKTWGYAKENKLLIKKKRYGK